MSYNTYNESVWAGKFGGEYTKRNLYNPEELDALYSDRYGVTRTKMNRTFLKDVNKEARILEVGCNAGNQLVLLQKMGFKNLTGVEINPDAVQVARSRVSNPIFTGSASDLSLFDNNYFDLIFTSGVLIHINPNEVLKVMSQIARVSKQYIWGFEYFSQGQTEVTYRDKTDLLWRNNYAQMYEVYCGVKLVKETFYPNKDDKKLIDHMFLLEKIS